MQISLRPAGVSPAQPSVTQPGGSPSWVTQELSSPQEATGNSLPGLSGRGRHLAFLRLTFGGEELSDPLGPVKRKHSLALEGATGGGGQEYRLRPSSVPEALGKPPPSCGLRFVPYCGALVGGLGALLSWHCERVPCGISRAPLVAVAG